MKILRGTVKSLTSGSVHDKVSVTVPGICDSLPMEVVNGVYLRPNELVYVYFEDDYSSPLVLGRSSGQFELEDLVSILNGFIQKYNNHTHVVPEPASSALIYDTILAAAKTGSPPTWSIIVSLIQSAAFTAARAVPTTSYSTTSVETTKTNDDLLY